MKSAGIIAVSLILALTLGTSASQIKDEGNEILIETTGYTNYGNWSALGTIAPDRWKPGVPLTVDVMLQVQDNHIARITEGTTITADGFCLLVTAERTFDADGKFHQINDEKMSTLLTPAGLPIEGGIQGACTNRYGYDFRTPFDQFVSIPFDKCRKVANARLAHFQITAPLPGDLPPGIYRVRLDFGITAKTKVYT